MSNLTKNTQPKEEKEQSLLVTKESFAAAGTIFSLLAFLILCTRSWMFGDLGLAVHSFLTGVFGYLAYPLIVGAGYLCVTALLGKRLVKNRRVFSLACLTLFSVSLLVHTALTFNWARDGYIFACFSSGETFPATTVTGGLGGILVFGVSAVLSNIGAIVFFAALSAFLGYLTMMSLRDFDEAKAKAVAQKREKKTPVVKEAVKQTTVSPKTEVQTPIVQRPGISLQEQPIPRPQPSQPQPQTYAQPSTGAFSPFGMAEVMEENQRRQQQPDETLAGYQNSREFLFGSTPAENYRTNLIFDPNASVNRKPPVSPVEKTESYTEFTPSYTQAYENSVNEQPTQERPPMIVSDNTQSIQQPSMQTEEPSLEKMSFLAEEPPKPIETTRYPSYDEQPAPLYEPYAPQQNEEIDFKKLREETREAENKPEEEREYRRHDYMDMFSPSNPRLFEDGNDPFARRREDVFPERGEREDREDRYLSQPRDEYTLREEFPEETRESREVLNDFSEEPRGRDALHIFDEEDDLRPMRSEPEEETESGRGRGESARSTFGFGDREERSLSREVSGTPKLTESQSLPEPPKPQPPKPRIIKPYKRVPLDDFDCRDIEPTQNEMEVEETKANIIAILEEFKVTGATVASVSFGPTVTRYNIALPRSVSPQKILSLDQSIALGLRSNGVNIYPNYEDGVVSIEVPNKERQFVKLGCMLSGNTFVNSQSSSLMFAMGKNVANVKVYGDISKMIHMLVAGSSGSGKSVFLGALIISLIYKYSPQELRLILIDPKKTEFVLYNNLPHLMINEIITDANKAIQSLNWAIGEMNRRYGLFEQMSRSGTYVVNLDEYNAQLLKKGQKDERLPKLVIIIDELADLMLAAKKEMEDRIQNLTQKARAAGIHLIVATQRPSTDVITGVIKSNLATRIAFRVASDVDSRVILDQSGAQKLLGKGDLLYTMPGINTPVRVQSAFISPEDSQKVVNYIKENNEAYYDEEATAFINNTNTGGSDPATGDKGGEIDPMYIEALRHVILSGSASISMIQRKCSAGYNRAGRIIEWMEDMGYISAFDGAKARKVLITKEQFESLYGPL